MNIPPRTPPRFLPTLTQVVDPIGLGLPVSTVAIDPEQLVQIVLQQVDAALMDRMRKQMEETLLLKWQSVAASLRDEFEPMVRALVSETLAAQSDQEKSK